MAAKGRKPNSKPVSRTSNNPISDPVDALRAILQKNHKPQYFQVISVESGETLTYLPSIYSIIPDLFSYEFCQFNSKTSQAAIFSHCSSLKYGNISGFDVISRSELNNIAFFYEELCNNPKIMLSYSYIFSYAANNKSINTMNYDYQVKNFIGETVSKYSKTPIALIPIYRLFPDNKTRFQTKTIDEVLERFLDLGLIPLDIDDIFSDKLIELYDSKKESSVLSEEKADFSDDLSQKTENRKSQEINNAADNFDRNYDFSEDEKALLECDYKRFDYIRYEKDRLYDPMLGHWDLWCADESGGLDRYVNKNGKVARNPKLDVHFDYTAAIDFGTSSTVVVMQGNSENKTALRIGTSDLLSQSQNNHYENPTYMEFGNLSAFLNSFNSSIGRPDTKYNDLAVSHNARNSMISNMGVLDKFYTYFSDLKQWADGQKETPVIYDGTGKSFQLKNFLETQDDDVNPLVYYAYYIGLHINNMTRGICLDYLLSYPVTYEKTVCEKIRQSFEIGIKKSLPVAVLEDERLMRYFRVSLTASEPASYACCALKEYGIEPDEHNKILYGVFDFGGGTSDYDYGIYEEEPDDDRFDYRLTRFQSVGDRYLGGENILDRVAYAVYLANYDKMVAARIPFVKPLFVDNQITNEILISANPTVSAKMNSFAIKEKLRPYWERSIEFDDKEVEISDIALFDIDGRANNKIKITFKPDEINGIIRGEICKGVRNFFSGLTNAIYNLPDGNTINDFKKVYIFLAGNSSRSPIVKEEFDKCISEFCDKKGQASAAKTIYEVLPPLGTDEANERIGNTAAQSYRPNCKTGVAYGLLDFRHGSNIKFVSKEVANRTEERIKFKFYVGRKKKKNLVPILTPNNAYDKWYPFIPADLPDFELYYTEASISAEDDISIQDTLHKRVRLDDTDPNKMVYIRAVSSDEIEYSVFSEAEVDNEKKGESVKLV